MSEEIKPTDPENPFPDYPVTYTISPDGKSITCLRCKMTSPNLNDVQHRFCARCKMFHDDIYPAARQWWLDHPDPEKPKDSK